MPSHGVVRFLPEVLLNYASAKGKFPTCFITCHSHNPRSALTRLTSGTTVRLTGRVSSSYNSALSADDDCGRSCSAPSWQLDWEGSKIEVHPVNSDYQCGICSGVLTLVLDRCQQLQRRAAAARFNVSIHTSTPTAAVPCFRL